MMPGQPKPVQLAVDVDRQEVLHYLGYPAGHRPRRGVVKVLDEALDEARTLVRPAGVFRRMPGERFREVGLPDQRGPRLVIGLVTVGAAIEERVAVATRGGEISRALVLDAAGSAAAEEAADRLCAHILGPAYGRPVLRSGCRVSPGYGGWPLTAQTDLFRLLPHDQIGVALLPSLMMVPTKSVSFAMWIGEDRMPVRGLSGCGHCLLERCDYRRGSAG